MVDFEVQRGAFAGLRLEYPYPHTLRRNFTLRPFAGSQMMVNLTFTKEKMAKLVESYTGHYRGFQTDLEATKVRSPSHGFPPSHVLSPI